MATSPPGDHIDHERCHCPPSLSASPLLRIPLLRPILPRLFSPCLPPKASVYIITLPVPHLFNNGGLAPEQPDHSIELRGPVDHLGRRDPQRGSRESGARGKALYASPGHDAGACPEEKRRSLCGGGIRSSGWRVLRKRGAKLQSRASVPAKDLMRLCNSLGSTYCIAAWTHLRLVRARPQGAMHRSSEDMHTVVQCAICNHTRAKARLTMSPSLKSQVGRLWEISARRCAPGSRGFCVLTAMSDPAKARKWVSCRRAQHVHQLDPLCLDSRMCMGLVALPLTVHKLCACLYRAS
jgi:hypothetical protein